MCPRSRARYALLVILAIPLASAGAVTVPTEPEVPSVPLPGTPPLPDPNERLDIAQHGLTFQGPAGAPTRVGVVAPDGRQVLDYRVDAQGRARLDVADTNAIADATLVTIEGNVLADEFTLILRDAEGKEHRVLVDKVALRANAELPRALQEPIVEILRPSSWPGAPSRSFFLNVQDSSPTILAASSLTGVPYLRLAGDHRAVIQVPAAEADFDLLTLRVTHATSGLAANVTFERAHATADAVVFRAGYFPAQVGAASNDTLRVQPFYERRANALVVERFADARVGSYRVDGEAPSVTLTTPPEADDFSFAISWNGEDALTGVAGFRVEWREEGQGLWTRWLDRTQAKSATFSGAWGKTYHFRAFAIDGAGNPSSTPAASTTLVKAPPGGVEEDVNDPPTARLLTPATGSTVGGVTSVTWSASDPDGTPVTSKLELSVDEGVTWRVLYTGTAKSATWDTTVEEEGPGYRLRLVASDGTLQALDMVGALTVRNVVAPPPAPPTSGPAPSVPPSAPASTAPGSQPGHQPAEVATRPPAPDAVATPAGTAPEAPKPAEDEPAKKGVPAPFAGLAVLAAALLAGRRFMTK